MDLLQLLVSSGVIETARAVELRGEIAKPGASAEAVLTKEGVSLAQILKAKGN